MELYSFFNSATSYRVRIALALKGISYETRPVNIRKYEHRSSNYIAEVNASAAVPALASGSFRLGQSIAIIDFLDRLYPNPRLIPEDSMTRARVIEFASLIACDIHPVNNLRVLRYLEEHFQATQEQKQRWYRHWVAEGMTAAERMLQKDCVASWCFGVEPSLADLCLIPQVANALRMGCDLESYPLCRAVFEHATSHPAFEAASPQNQPDYIDS